MKKIRYLLALSLLLVSFNAFSGGIRQNFLQPSTDAGPRPFSEQTSNPPNSDNVGWLFTQDVTDVTELFYQDSLGNDVQLTNVGSINSGTSPTDSTDAISTTGASGSYSETTVTNVTSSIDPTITNIGYRRTYDTGHAAPGMLVNVALFPGFGQNGVTAFPDAMSQRIAGYVDPNTGRAPMVLELQTRGRGNLGTIDYARDSQDVIDIIDHATAAVGANVYGYGTTGGASAIAVGYSTGALDALNFAARYPDRCLGVVLYFPNYDIGVDSADSYYVIQSPAIRASIAASVQPGGDVRLTPHAFGTSENIDQYTARNPIDAIARVMAIPNGPHVWLIGDLDETETLPTFTRLRDALQSIPAARAKAHIHLTQTGDSNRVLHADGVNGASEIYAERYFYPYLLKNAAEWTMPRQSPPGGLRVLGHMKTKLFELWLGPTTNPKSSASAGGLDHAAELQYDDYTRRYKITPVTATDGYFQVIRDVDNRSIPFLASASTTVALDAIQSITSVADVGFQMSWRADSGVTDSSGVTSWVDALGGVIAFTASANKPSYTTDGDGESLVRFASASSQKLLNTTLLLDPTQDFTACTVVNKTNSTLGSFFEFSSHVNLSRTGLLYTSGVDNGYAKNSTNGTMLSNVNDVGGHTFSQNAKHSLCLMRKSDYLWLSIDGSSWSKTAYIAGTYTTSGSNTTSLGAGWANSGGAYWQFLQGDIYEVDFKQSATSEADIFAYNALMKSRWTY